MTIGVDGDLYGTLDATLGPVLGMAMCCPDFGTLECIDCEYGVLRPLDVCDAHCTHCRARKCCPCTKAAWERRRESV